MAIELTDDGTLDTILRCSECGEEMRYNYDGRVDLVPEGDMNTCEHGNVDGCEACYDAFVEWAIEDATNDHECPADPDAEPTDPQEDDITTTDHETFYQSGKLVLERERTQARELTARWFYRDSRGIMQPLTRGILKNVGVQQFGDDVNAALRTYMDRVQFWPNVWLCSDHGNWHLIDLSELR